MNVLLGALRKLCLIGIGIVRGIEEADRQLRETFGSTRPKRKRQESPYHFCKEDE